MAEKKELRKGARGLGGLRGLRIGRRGKPSTAFRSSQLLPFASLMKLTQRSGSAAIAAAEVAAAAAAAGSQSSPECNFIDFGSMKE